MAEIPREVKEWWDRVSSGAVSAAVGSLISAVVFGLLTTFVWGDMIARMEEATRRYEEMMRRYGYGR